MPPIHLSPAAPLAERVLLPGDPGRALAVAQALTDAPKMFNHSRGLWGYTGVAADGEPITIQSTGMGGPSAAIVCEELIALGARRLVRIGTCGALVQELELGDLLAAATVLPEDGASRALGARDPLEANHGLTERLAAAGARPATTVSADLFYDPRAEAAAGWRERGAIAVEMEAATVLAVAARHDVAAGCVLAVTDVPSGNAMRRVSAEQLEALGLELGRAGLAAFTSP